MFLGWWFSSFPIFCIVFNIIISQTIENETILPIYFWTSSSSYWHMYDFHNNIGHIWNIILITNIFHTCFVLPIIHRKIWLRHFFDFEIISKFQFDGCVINILPIIMNTMWYLLFTKRTIIIGCNFCGY